MAYDASLDRQVFAKSWTGSGTKVTVGVYSYNGGVNKVQLSREVLNEEGRPSFSKLGRLTKEEVQGVLPLLQEALAAMG